jgi:hypothetical protein
MRGPVALILSGVLLAACSSARDAATGTVRRDIVAREVARLDAMPGRAVVVPLVGRPWADEAWFRAGTTLPVRYDDGSSGMARVVRASVEPSLDAADRPAAWWLAWPGRWSIAREHAPGVGVWLLVIDAPPHDARRITVGERTLVLNTLTTLRTRPDVWNPPFTIDATAEPLASALRLESLSPLTRWRSRWLTRGLLTTRTVDDAPDRFGDPLLETLADLTEARVAAAIARLDSIDPQLARRLARALVLVVSMGDGHAPAYPIADRDIDLLMHELLDTPAGEARAAAAARAWLRAQPEGFAWVVDDAGIVDGLSASILSTLGVANLADAPRPVWLTSPSRPSPDMTLCPAFSASLVTAAAWSTDQPSTGSTAVTISMGSWRAQAVLRGAPVPVAPPGFVAAPFVHDWTLPALRDADERTLSPESHWATAALVHRLPADHDVLTPTTGDGHDWALYLECRRPHDAPDGSDRVTIHLGPTAAPLAIIGVGSDGSIEATGPHADTHARVITLTDRWIATVRLPRGAIDADGVLRLGLTRVDSRGVRSAWPRPMLPWSSRPGRLALDTRAWDR